MMATLGAWLLRKHCIHHADPLFDRDENGRAIFRCPECLHAWPILPGFEPRPFKAQPPLVVQHERRVEWRPAPVPPPVRTPAAVVTQPRRLGSLPVM
jgi:hypothetical protein